MSKNIFVIYLVGFLDLFAVSMVIPLLVAHCKSLGASPTVAGVIGSTYGLIQFFSGPFMGKCSDNYGRKYILQICFFVCSVTYLLLSISFSLAIVFLSRIPAGLFKHTQELAKSYIASSITIKERSATFGRFNSISNVGFIMGPVIGGYLAEHFGGVYLVAVFTSAIFFLNFALVTLFLEEKISKKQQSSDQILFPFSSFFQCISVDFISRLWIILAIRFLMAFAVFVFRFDPLYALSPTQSGWIISCSGAASAVSGFFVGSVNALYSGNDRRLLLHLAIMQGISLVFLTVFTDFWSQLLFNIPFSMVNSITRVVATNMTLDLAQKKDIGVVMGVGGSTISVGRFLGPLAGGLMQEIGPRGPGVLGSLSSFACAFIIIASTKSSRHKKMN